MPGLLRRGQSALEGKENIASLGSLVNYMQSLWILNPWMSFYPLALDKYLFSSIFWRWHGSWSRFVQPSSSPQNCPSSSQLSPSTFSATIKCYFHNHSWRWTVKGNGGIGLTNHPRADLENCSQPHWAGRKPILLDFKSKMNDVGYK